MKPYLDGADKGALHTRVAGASFVVYTVVNLEAIL